VGWAGQSSSALWRSTDRRVRASPVRIGGHGRHRGAGDDRVGGCWRTELAATERDSPMIAALAANKCADRRHRRPGRTRCRQDHRDAGIMT
jgi:hypothetical protein